MSVIAIALLVTFLLALVSKVSIIELANSITLMFIVACIVLVSDDFFYKLYNNRKIITKDYVIGESIYLASIFTFALSFFAGTMTATIVWLSVSVVSFTGAISWTYYAYKNPKWTAEEIEEIKWNELRKNFAFMDKERCKVEISKFLRFKLEGNSIEGNIDVAHPFDGECFSTLKELKDRNAKPTMIYTVNQYIDLIIDKYYNNEVKGE
jgi:hypothetical protein